MNDTHPKDQEEALYGNVLIRLLLTILSITFLPTILYLILS